MNLTFRPSGRPLAAVKYRQFYDHPVPFKAFNINSGREESHLAKLLARMLPGFPLISENSTFWMATVQMLVIWSLATCFVH